jgi:hypothetical protein
MIYFLGASEAALKVLDEMMDWCRRPAAARSGQDSFVLFGSPYMLAIHALPAG